MSEPKFREVGKVTHFFSKISVAVIELSDTLSVGDSILVKGMTTDVKQLIDSMQIDQVNIQKAEAGQSIGLKVDDRVREGDTVYRVLE